MVATSGGCAGGDFRPKYSEIGEFVSRSTGAKGEVPQAPANRSEASHEGEKHALHTRP